MDAPHFDDLTKRLTTGLTRRRTLGLLTALGVHGLVASEVAEAKKKKKKPCPPCKKRKKGKCRGTLPEGTGCTDTAGRGGTCQSGTCVATPPPPPPATCTPACQPNFVCQNGTCVAAGPGGPVTCTPPCGFNQVCQGTTCVPAANQCPTAFTCTCPFGGPDPASNCGTQAGGGICTCHRSTEGNTVCLNPTATAQACTSSQQCRNTVGFGFFCKAVPRCATNGVACGPDAQRCYPRCDNPA